MSQKYQIQLACLAAVQQAMGYLLPHVTPSSNMCCPQASSQLKLSQTLLDRQTLTINNICQDQFKLHQNSCIAPRKPNSVILKKQFWIGREAKYKLQLSMRIVGPNFHDCAELGKNEAYEELKYLVRSDEL